MGRESNLWPNFSCLYKHLVETELQSILSDWLNTTENTKKKLIISQGNKRLTWFGINRTWENYVTMYLLKLIILYKIHTAQIPKFVEYLSTCGLQKSETLHLVVLLPPMAKSFPRFCSLVISVSANFRDYKLKRELQTYHFIKIKKIK